MAYSLRVRPNGHLKAKEEYLKPKREKEIDTLQIVYELF